MQLDATLRRFDSSDQGTFGRFEAGRLFFYSGELPDRRNAPSVSRVPAGAYQAAFTWSPRFHRCLYLLAAVPNRSGIRIHPANTMGDASKGMMCQLNGCIALGEKLGYINGQKAILLSAPAVRRVEEYFEGRSFLLGITDES